MLLPVPLSASCVASAARERLGDLFARAGEPDTRALRVALLVVATALMGLGDLYLTLNFVMTTGMVELNPIARAVIELGCPNFVVAWKVVLILISSGILWATRRHRFAEAGAWVCFLVLVALTFHWVSFVAGISSMGDDYYALQALAQQDHRYVMLSAD